MFGFWVFVKVKRQSTLMEYGIQFEVFHTWYRMGNVVEHQHGYRICRGQTMTVNNRFW